MSVVGSFGAMHEMDGIDRGDGQGKRLHPMKINVWDDTCGKDGTVDSPKMMRLIGQALKKLKIKQMKLRQSWRLRMGYNAAGGIHPVVVGLRLRLECLKGHPISWKVGDYGVNSCFVGEGSMPAWIVLYHHDDKAELEKVWGTVLHHIFLSAESHTARQMLR